MADKRHLTDAFVRRLPPPEKDKRITLDDEVIGFGVRVTAAGARSYILRYTTRAGRERTFTIGDAAAWKTTAARAKARDLRRDIEDGGDPLGEVEAERAAPTMAELCDRFEHEHLPRKRQRTADEYRRMLAVHVRPHFGPHAKVAGRDVRRRRRAPPQDHQERRHLRGEPVHRDRVEDVLARGALGLPREQPGEGHREEHRVRPTALPLPRGAGASHRGAGEAPGPAGGQHPAAAAALRLHARRSAGDALGDVDLTEGIWSKPPSSTKQKEHHQVPLSRAGAAIAERAQVSSRLRIRRRLLPTYVFPGAGGSGHRVEIKTPWRQLTKAAGITGLRMHDLRHSFASQLASGGASLPLIGALLGHSNPSNDAPLQRILLDDPQREAVERVGAVITAAGKPAPAPPVTLKGRGRP